jgi:hypothetical protein
MPVGELLQKTSRKLNKNYRRSEKKFDPLGMEESEE